MGLNVIKDETSFISGEDAADGKKPSTPPVDQESASNLPPTQPQLTGLDAPTEPPTPPPPPQKDPWDPPAKETKKRTPRAQSLILSDEADAVKNIHAFLQGLAKGPEILASFTEMINEKNARIQMLEGKFNTLKELFKDV